MTFRTSGCPATVGTFRSISASRIAPVTSVSAISTVPFEPKETACSRRERCERAAVVELDPVAEGEPRQRAVHGAGVEVAEAEPPGEGRRDRALAGARGAVDRHDHERSCIALGPFELREHVVEARKAHLDRLRAFELDALA